MRLLTAQLYEPQGYNAAKRTVPVMVAVHGAGGDGKDMVNTFMVRHIDMSIFLQQDCLGLMVSSFRDRLLSSAEEPPKYQTGQCRCMRHRRLLPTACNDVVS